MDDGCQVMAIAHTSGLKIKADCRTQS